MTEFVPTVIKRGMGRPPIKHGLKVKQAAVWLHEDLLTRIKDTAGKQGFSEFMRDAAERELKRRIEEKLKHYEPTAPTPKTKPKANPPSPTKGEG